MYRKTQGRRLDSFKFHTPCDMVRCHPLKKLTKGTPKEPLTFEKVVIEYAKNHPQKKAVPKKRRRRRRRAKKAVSKVRESS